MLDGMGDNRALHTQRVLLCAWLVELKLDRLNKLNAMAENEGARKTLRADTTALRTDTTARELQEFLDKYKESVDSDTILQLMQSHGRLEDCVWFAKQQV